MLLTRAPLYSSPEGDFRVRRACLRHAASVDSEPGSNSRYKFVHWNIILLVNISLDNDSSSEFLTQTLSPASRALVGHLISDIRLSPDI